MANLFHTSLFGYSKADALICAKDYASGLQRQAEADDQARRAVNAAYQEAELRRVQNVAEQVSSLHQAFHNALQHMDQQLTSYTEEIHRLQALTGEQREAVAPAHTQKEEESWEKDGGQAS